MVLLLVAAWVATCASIFCDNSLTTIDYFSKHLCITYVFHGENFGVSMAIEIFYYRGWHMI